mmetsp:Transcript_92248/g.282372  ORF Transcript_92248/g.282372 Transcript_92248/m.282372 type:complete len:204 (+) Transcript_92248:846-1457(+)
MVSLGSFMYASSLSFSRDPNILSKALRFRHNTSAVSDVTVIVADRTDFLRKATSPKTSPAMYCLCTKLSSPPVLMLASALPAVMTNNELPTSPWVMMLSPALYLFTCMASATFESWSASKDSNVFIEATTSCRHSRFAIWSIVTDITNASFLKLATWHCVSQITDAWRLKPNNKVCSPKNRPIGISRLYSPCTWISASPERTM